MFNWLRYWWQEFILRQFHKYYIVGGHCGFCGKWVQDAVCDKYWAWTHCKECIEKYSKPRMMRFKCRKCGGTYKLDQFEQPCPLCNADWTETYVLLFRRKS